ncbi:sentrin-specific protease 2 isoform X1 [Alosa alosa]|uniref:sentrin-specific protease 2 isoform X1 n=1 Tax=Alosa alosa TaxID=278164 RepID=UPI002015370B|nr:sentrin-specific protease 2 isoform X1 [Alosa alosa]
MYEWIVDGISSLFVPFSGGKSRSWPKNGGVSEAARTPDEQRQDNYNNRPAKRNYQSVHSPEGTSEPVEIKRPRRGNVILSTVKKTLAGVAGFLRLRHPKPSLQNDHRSYKKAPLQPVALAGIDEIPNSNLSMWIMNGNVKMDKLREGGSTGQEKTVSAFGNSPLPLNRKQDSGAMVFRGAQDKTQRRSLPLMPASDLAGRPHKPCLAVEEALKESDREQYLRLVEMVSEKYSKSKPLPFAQMKPLMTSLPLDGHKQTVFGRTCDTSLPKRGPVRANPSVSMWRDPSSGKQTKDRTVDMGLSKPVGDCRSTGVEEQSAWKGKTKPVDVDLSAEVAARLNLKDKEPSLPALQPVPVPPGFQSRPASQADSRLADEDLPRLSKEMQMEVSAALAQRDPNLVLSSAFKLRITQRDLATLQEGSWLNDEVINFYLNLVMSRSEEQKGLGGQKVYSFNTFFFPKLHGGGHAAVRRWTKAVDLFTYNIILVPLHLGVHWSLTVVDLKAKSVKSYDSMGQRHDDICNLILLYLKEEMNVKKGKDLDVTKWTLSSLKASEIPQQKNGSDCGVFACKYADYISRGRPLTFRQCHMPLFRKLMIWEILNQRLL